MKLLVIVDLGTGNLASVSNALSHVCDDIQVRLSAAPELIGNADLLVLPGQGSLGTWFNQLNQDKNLSKAVTHRLNNGAVLGICLGLQALYAQSEENNGTAGLDILQGEVVRFPQQLGDSPSVIGAHTPKRKVPHIGWNQVNITQFHPLWKGIEDATRFYFCHSYYVHRCNDQQVFARAQYGKSFTAAAGLGSLFATQFHPEKSSVAGLKLLKNFCNWDGKL